MYIWSEKKSVQNVTKYINIRNNKKADRKNEIAPTSVTNSFTSLAAEKDPFDSTRLKF